MTRHLDDTIAAVSTAAGRAGVSVIRISGERARAIAATLGATDLTPRHSALVELRGIQGRVLDRVLATWFEAPASYTGEDVVELSCHGGVLVPALVLDAACEAGARPARPGEFTKRAYLNGKLDLIQAEATLDLIDATSAVHHDAAIGQLTGSLSRRVESLRQGLLELQAAIAYDIDFPDEDEGPIPAETIRESASRIETEISELVRHAPEGERLRNGALAVIAGPINIGKSSLFNELQGFPRSIVTEVPGTTRDAIEADISIQGYPFRLVDTAGIRHGAEPIEEIGIEIARGYLSRADIVLLCVDARTAPSSADLELARQAERLGAAVVRIRTRSDLSRAGPERGSELGSLGDDEIFVSARTGKGMDELREALVEASFSGLRASGEPPLVTRQRQIRALTDARRDVRRFREVFGAGHPAEIASTHLTDATASLETLIGITDVEDVLEAVFRSFCVGK